ncbi:MAG: helix-turn-helix domain-containing protein [Lachnospiraceae bacterium]|nr:helix-turn-helix domain-containing protein [Lachnospiraceae bacterium]
MNYGYILEHTSKSLYTSIRMYDCRNNLLKVLKKDPDLKDDVLCKYLLSSSLLTSSHKDMPLLFLVNEKLVYAWITTEIYHFLLGPLMLVSPTLSFINRLDISTKDETSLENHLPASTLELIAENCAMIYNVDRLGDKNEPFVEASEILFANCLPKDRHDETLTSLTKTMFDHIENSFAHNPFSHEKLETTYIKNGDVENLKKLLNERFPGRYGRLSKDPIRQEIYLSIVAITVACRAAIDAGLHPEIAFSLSDVSIQRIDTCKDPVEMLQCTIEAELHYAKLVRELNKDSTSASDIDENIHISRCKDYIFSHLHGKIAVTQIANAVGLDENYLSALFKRHMHITLKAYILEEKIKLIKNLLTYSSYSFTEISAYLGFASQSHMGMEFKKITRMTLKQYRSRYLNDDFVKESMNLEMLENV